MKAIEEVVARYEEAEKDTELAPMDGYSRVYGYKNHKLREQLREEYVALLPLNQRVAILLHSRLCRDNHTDGCGFFYGVKGLKDDWSEYSHKEYLKKANKLIECLRGYGISKDKVYQSVIDIMDSLNNM